MSPPTGHLSLHRGSTYRVKVTHRSADQGSQAGTQGQRVQISRVGAFGASRMVGEVAHWLDVYIIECRFNYVKLDLM